MIAIALAIACVPPAAPTHAASEYQQLKSAFREAFERGSWLAAIDFGKRLHEMHPDDGSVAYGIACAYARFGDAESGLHWLGTASSDGFSAVALLERDEDVATIRALEGFDEVAQQVEANAAKRLEQFKSLVSDEEPLVYVPRELAGSTSRTVIIVLHGRGGHPLGIARACAGPARRLGAAIVAPSAGRRSGAGYEWRYVDESAWLVLETRRWAIDNLDADPDRIILAGFSQGANLALRMTLAHPDLFMGAIALGAHWYDDLWPGDFDPSGNRIPRIALVVGSRDQSAQSNDAAHELLESRGIPIRYKSMRGLGHALPNDRGREIERSLRFVLDPER